MNIFYLSSDPKFCAQYHVDKHVVKMILETCQLLSTAHRILDGTESVQLSSTNRKQKVWTLLDRESDQLLYKATHVNHPSAVWVRQSYENYVWLAKLLVELSDEYTYRFGKIHKCTQIGLIDWLLANEPKNIPMGSNFSEPPCAMPEQYIVPNNSILSYRNYYTHGKSHLHKWTKRFDPHFLFDNVS